MRTNSRLIKPPNYPAPTAEDIRMSAAKLIFRRIGGAGNMADRIKRARNHPDPLLRQAALIMDLARAEPSERQAGLGSDLHPSGHVQVGAASQADGGAE